MCKPSEIPCRDGHIKCYNFSDICIFKLNQIHHLTPCRNGANLESCEPFQCNSMFKCQGSYCVPWNYVCDGKWDCPNGDDEHSNPVCGNEVNCINMYKCRHKRTICLQLGNICNGERNCPNGDDEMFCQLINSVCPSGCQCLILAVKCTNLNFKKSLLFSIGLFVSVDISFSTLDSPVTIQVQSIEVLKLTRNNIKEICLTSLPNNVTYLDLSFNLIKYILIHCFSHSNLLFTLILKCNIISQLSTKSFFNLPNLRFLDLSENPLIFIPNYSFKNLPKLSLLNLKSPLSEEIESNMFENIKLSPVIINTNYHVYCVSPDNTICTLYPPWYASCSGFLNNKQLKVIFFLIIFIILIANVWSLFIHMSDYQSTKPFLLTIAAINMSDLIFGMYLAVILVSNLVLHKTLFLSGLWKSHFLCFTAFGTLLWFTLLSQLLLTFMSVSRYRVITCPLKTKFKQASLIKTCIFILYCMSFCISLFITLSFKHVWHSAPIDLCLPFVDPSNSKTLIRALTWYIVISQTLSSIIITTMYILLYQMIRKSKKAVSTNKSKSHFTMIIQLVLITASNILCWFPTNIIYVAAMLMSTYPIDIVLWTIITVLPCNSIVNPLVFIIGKLKRVRTG